MNKVILTGNIVRDIQIKSNGEKSFAVGTIAVKRDYKNADGNYDSDYINFIAFGGKVDYLAKFSHKGDRLELIGRWQTRQIAEPSGVIQYRNELVVEDCYVITKKEEPKEKEFKYNEIDFKKAEEKGELPF